MLEKEWNENEHDPPFPVYPVHLNNFFSNCYTVASSYTHTHTYTLTTANAVPFSVAKRNNKTIRLKINIIDPL